MKKNKNAFTMIELVFVIVILGILAAVAVPRLSATRQDAQLTKGKADVSTIRSAIINERQSRLFRGDSRFITALDSAAVGANGTPIFGGLAAGVMANTNGVLTVLTYPIITSANNGHWMKTAGPTYTFTVSSGTAVFTYTSATGTFDCAPSTVCSLLTQ